MRCPECQQEVVLARTCPYCGAEVPQPEEPVRGRDDDGGDHPRGRFQGRMEGAGSESGDRGRPTSAARPGGFFGQLTRYMLHPEVPLRSKLLVILGGLYLLSPLDLLPGLFPISWLDDLSLIGFMWWWLGREFGRYR